MLALVASWDETKVDAKVAIARIVSIRSITSIHATSCELAFEQLMLLVKESPAGRELSRADIHVLLRQAIDVVIQVGTIGGKRAIQEIWLSTPH